MVGVVGKTALAVGVAGNTVSADLGGGAVGDKDVSWRAVAAVTVLVASSHI